MTNIPPLDEDVFDALLNVRRTMHIDKFRNTYMGLLSHENGPAPVGLWVQDEDVVSPFSEVDVVDGMGKTLFTIPPLLDNSSPVFKSLKGQRMYEALNAIELYYKASPRQGEAYMRTLENDISSGKINPRHIAMWNKVRKYFGLEPIAGTKHADAKTRSAEKATVPETSYRLL